MANQIDTDAKVLSTNVGGFGQQHLVRALARWYAGHINESGDLEIHASYDSGSNWALEKTFNDSNLVPYFSMEVDEDNNLYVCYLHGSGTSYTLEVDQRNYHANIWSNKLSESLTVTAAIPYAMIHFNRFQDRIHVFWLLDNAEGSSIKNKYSDDNGGTWSSIQGGGSVSATHRYIYNIDSSPSDGSVYVWYPQSSGYAGIGKFNVDGSWITDLRTYTSSYPFSNLAGVVDISGNEYTALQKNDSLLIYINAVANVEVPTGFGAVDGSFTMGVDGDDNVYLFYVKSSDNKIYYRKYDALGASWGSETAYTTSEAQRPRVEMHLAGSSDQFQLVYYGV